LSVSADSDVAQTKSYFEKGMTEAKNKEGKIILINQNEVFERSPTLDTFKVKEGWFVREFECLESVDKLSQSSYNMGLMSFRPAYKFNGNKLVSIFRYFLMSPFGILSFSIKNNSIIAIDTEINLRKFCDAFIQVGPYLKE
jgi:hypothetical protein